MPVTLPDLKFDGGSDRARTVVLAHGAGQPMDSPFMNVFAEGLADAGLRVARFEFPYMAARRRGGGRKAPDRPDVLMRTWKEVVAGLGGGEALVIGGKSMGGRMASMVADEVGARGLVCLGYPFHAAGRPDAPRIAHLGAPGDTDADRPGNPRQHGKARRGRRLRARRPYRHPLDRGR